MAVSDMWRLLNPRSGSLLKPLLVPRVPGTPGSRQVQNHITSHLSRHGWDVTKQDFVANTPIGATQMTNLVARRPGVHEGLTITLAAHYDSKREPDGFIGAIDSALPCALLLWLAQKDQLVNIELVFFDGEEAMQQWSDDDSIYGAKALAASGLVKPQLLMLLDLLGHRGPPVPSWFRNTRSIHTQLVNINDWLLTSGEVKRRVVGGPEAHNLVMFDDHLPFLAQGVPILHLIPSQFPAQWHTLDDNATLLDWDTIETWAVLLEKFLESQMTSMAGAKHAKDAPNRDL